MDFSNMNDVKIPAMEKPETAFPLDKLNQPEDFGKNTDEKSDGLEKLNKAEDWGKNNVELSSGGDKTSETDEVPTKKCLNQELCEKEHPVTDVPFVEKIVKDENGKYVKVVVPVFNSTFDAQLPEDKLQSTDREQFRECNKQLKESVENDPELAEQFTEEQLEQISNGDTPDGYTWHHHEDTGKMQLVDTVTHDKTAHTGGKVIWGGGRENR